MLIDRAARQALNPGDFRISRASQLQRSLGSVRQELSLRRSNRRIDTLNARPSKGGDEPCGLELPHGLARLVI